jgi:hypothetical protein
MKRLSATAVHPRAQGRAAGHETGRVGSVSVPSGLGAKRISRVDEFKNEAVEAPTGVGGQQMWPDCLD